MNRHKRRNENTRDVACVTQPAKPETNGDRDTQ